MQFELLGHESAADDATDITLLSGKPVPIGWASPEQASTQDAIAAEDATNVEKLSSAA